MADSVDVKKCREYAVYRVNEQILLVVV